MTDRPMPGGGPTPGAPGDAAGPHETAEPGLPPDEEPTTTGTLFVMLLFLMALAGMWALMYMVLLER